MVYPINVPSKGALQNAIFDYLNFNRHKFDESGNFNSRPDERDYVSPILAKYRTGPPREEVDWESFIGNIKDPQSATELRRQNLKTWTEEDENNARMHAEMADKGGLTRDKCTELWNEEVRRCIARWSGRNRAACKERARYRYHQCRDRGRYDDLREWGLEDLDMPEIEKEEFRKRFGRQGTRTNPNPNSSSTSGAKPSSSNDTKSERNPYIFGPPWGAPVIYRAPLMPPELQRKIPRKMHAHISPDMAFQLLLLALSRGRAGRVPSGALEPATGVLPMLRGAKP